MDTCTQTVNSFFTREDTHGRRSVGRALASSLFLFTDSRRKQLAARALPRAARLLRSAGPSFASVLRARLRPHLSTPNGLSHQPALALPFRFCPPPVLNVQSLTSLSLLLCNLLVVRCSLSSLVVSLCSQYMTAQTLLPAWSTIRVCLRRARQGASCNLLCMQWC